MKIVFTILLIVSVSSYGQLFDRLEKEDQVDRSIFSTKDNDISFVESGSQTLSNKSNASSSNEASSLFNLLLSKTNTKNTEIEKKTNSYLSSTLANKSKSNTNNTNTSTKSNTSSANQLKEKSLLSSKTKTTLSNQSLNSHKAKSTAEVQTTKAVKSRSKVKSNKSNSSELSLNERIELLEEKISKIVGTQMDLTSKYNSYMRKSRRVNTQSNNFHSFIQAYENKVQSLTRKMSSTQNEAIEKENKMQELVEKTTSEYHSLKSKLHHLEHEVKDRLHNEAPNIETDNLNVAYGLKVGDSAVVKTLVSDDATIGSVKIGNRGIVLGDDSIIQVEGQTIKGRDLIDGLRSLKMLRSKCGVNLEKCRQVNSHHDGRIALRRRHLRR